MYSSLPSASKIYVSSAKSRQKSASSAKRRRKKVESNPNNANNSDETLISIENKNDLEHEASSVLHSNISESSQSYWEKDDSSSELSLPTVKVYRRRSQASSGKSTDKTIIESPEKILGDELNVLENRIEVSPAKESDDEEDFVSDNYEQAAEITNERCKLSVRKDSLLSPIKSRNNFINESESNLKHFTNEHIEAQPLEFTEVMVNSTEREITAGDHNLDASNTIDIPSEHEENYVSIPQPNENVVNDVENSLDEGNHNVHGDVNANVQYVSSQSSLNINQESTENLKKDHDEDDLPKSCETMDEKSPEIHLSKDSLAMESVPHKDSTRAHSPEPSEKSCTESLMSESRVSRLEITPAESKSPVGYPEFDDGKAHSHSNICQSYSDLGRAKCPSLHRFPSWPSNLDYSKNFYKTPVSKTASFSDKATYTVDLLPTKCDKESSSDDMTWKDDSVETESKSVSTTFQEAAQRPPLGMLQARSRSYVFGSMGPKGSLLGSDELNRLFPDNQVTVFIGTWNMNGQNPSENIDDFLLPLGISTLPDIYAIGIQEGSQSKSEWEILLQTTLGPSHVLFTSSSLGVLHLSVFLRRDLIWFCSEPEEASVATRPGAMVKTKGAVAVCFMFFGTSFLFVNSHLTAHEQKLKERVSDYEKICSSLDLPKLLPLKSNNRNKDVTSRFDCVFWCGDLNFRVIRDRPSVMSFVDQKNRKSCSFLVKHDQLHKAMAEGTAFHGFKEGVINFIPSYKFDVGTSTFAEAKLRVPSYTDRILYRCKEDKSFISCLHYNAASDILTSDHKPVFAVFKVSLRPGRDNVPLAGGMFKRDIYLEAIKRRARFLEVQRGQSTICSVM